MRTDRAVTRTSSERVAIRPIEDRQTSVKTLPSLAVGKNAVSKNVISENLESDTETYFLEGFWPKDTLLLVLSPNYKTMTWTEQTDMYELTTKSIKLLKLLTQASTAGKNWSVVTVNNSQCSTVTRDTCTTSMSDKLLSHNSKVGSDRFCRSISVDELQTI